MLTRSTWKWLQEYEIIRQFVILSSAQETGEKTENKKNYLHLKYKIITITEIFINNQ